MVITYNEAESALQELNKEKSSHYYWDGWKICKFIPNPVAIWSKDGSYNKDFGWGFTTTFEVDQDGLWRIDS